MTGHFAHIPNAVLRMVTSGTSREAETPTMVKSSFVARPWRPSPGELRRLLAPGYVQGHMLSVKVVGRIVLLVLPPLMRPGRSSDDVVFGESTLPGVTAIPALIFNHPNSLSHPGDYDSWKARMEDVGNSFLMDLTEAGCTNAFPALIRVEFALGAYRMPEPLGVQEVMKLAPLASFTRKYRALANHVMSCLIRDTDGLSAMQVEPVWVVN